MACLLNNLKRNRAQMLQESYLAELHKKQDCYECSLPFSWSTQCLTLQQCIIPVQAFRVALFTLQVKNFQPRTTTTQHPILNTYIYLLRSGRIIVQSLNTTRRFHYAVI